MLLVIVHRRVLRRVSVVGVHVLGWHRRIWREVPWLLILLRLLGLGKFLCYLVNECEVFLLFSVEPLREFSVDSLETLSHVLEH